MSGDEPKAARFDFAKAKAKAIARVPRNSKDCPMEDLATYCFASEPVESREVPSLKS